MFKHEYQCRACHNSVFLNSLGAGNPLLGTLHTHKGVMSSKERRTDPFLQSAKIVSVAGSLGQNCSGGLAYKGLAINDAPEVVAEPVPVPAATIQYGNLPSATAKAWVMAMFAKGNNGCDVANVNLPFNCHNRGKHNTDPRTSNPKAAGVGVREYDIGGNAGARATARTGPPANCLELFWSTHHMANTYNYHFIQNIPKAVEEEE